MRHEFGWGLPPGVSDWMIEEQAGAFEGGLMGERVRCKDCKWCRRWPKDAFCQSVYSGKDKVNPGQFACKKFVYRDK